MHRTSMPSPRPQRIAPALLLALLPPLASHAAEWRYLEAQQASPYAPVRVVASRDGSIWSFDGTGVRRTDPAGGRVTFERRALGSEFGSFDYSTGVATADGGLIAHDGNCHLLRITGDSRVTWRVEPTLQTCKGVRIAADGTSWVAGTRAGDGDWLLQLGVDGVQLAQRRASANEAALTGMHTLVDFAALDGGGNLELTHSLHNTDAALLRRDGNAAVQWRVEMSAARDKASLLAAAADGGADVLGSTGSTLWITRISAGGSGVFSRQIALSSSGSVLAAQRTAAGAVYVAIGDKLAQGVQPRRLLRITADGAPGWEQAYCAGSPGAPVARIDLVVVGESVNTLCSTGAQPQLVRRDAAGTTTTAALPLAIPQHLAAGNDGEVLALSRDNGQPPATRLSAVNASLQLRDVPLGAVNEPQALQALAAVVDEADGSTYLLSQRVALQGAPAEHFLSRISADGRLLWRKTYATPMVREATLTAAHGLVCVSEKTAAATPDDGNSTTRLYCLRNSGDADYGPAHVAAQDASRLQQRPLQDGSVVRIAADAGGFWVDRVTTTGATRLVSGNGTVKGLGIDDDGRFTLAVDARVIRYGKDGTELYRIATVQHDGYDSPFVADADGRVYVAVRQRAPFGGITGSTLWAIDAAGATRWETTIPTASVGATQLALRGDAVYLHQFGGANAGVAQSYTARHSAMDGSRTWWHPTIDRALSDTQRGTLLAVREENVLIASAGGNRLRLQRLAAGNGDVLLDRYIDCNGDCTTPVALGLNPAGEARVAFTVADRQAGQTAAAQSLGDVTHTVAAIRLDQPGIAGLWYAPYTSGEGIAIDWLPQSRTLFAARFTYRPRAGGNDPANLRWFTLQVNDVAPGTTELLLPVLQTTGGAFDAGPPVAPRETGWARLRFSDCNNATLVYEVNSSATTEYDGGRITLTRQTPATQPCILADGSTQPGAGARPPFQGFDARLSGAWYSESTIGQGLQLNIQPGGVLFAEWFTFDPSGGANDPTAQHWFTLQGNLAQANNGRVDALLVQTVGGISNWAPTWNANVVGGATLSVQGCDRITLDYHFEDARIAGPYRGRSGSLDLRRMGGCAP